MKLRDFFYMQKSDRKAALLLLLLATVAFAGVILLGRGNTKVELSAEDSLTLAQQHDTVYRYVGGGSSHGGSYYGVEGRRVERFAFDPNTADSTQLLRLGLKPWQVRSIYRFRASGGIFRHPADFAKVYGLTRGQFEELRPYIQISDYYDDARSYYTTNSHDSYVRDTVQYPVKMVPGEKISLNISDTSALKHVPGIGSGFARRIVRYRHQLGGFVSVDQLREINGFPESALAYFRMDSTAVNRMDVNHLSVNQLRSHPYINFYQARAINDFRRLHGPLQSLDQLRLMKEFTPKDLQRLAPYVTFKN